MAIEIFPVPVTSSINASSLTATTSNTLYEGLVSLQPAIYTITCTSGTVAKVQFFSNATTLITTATTISGTISINLSTTADRVRLWTDTGSNVVVTITKTASALTNVFSGTLDTITTTGTYTGTSTSGYGYVVLVGGGGGGAGGNGGGFMAGIGGGGGGVAEAIVALTGSMAVVIGTGGAGGANGGGGGWGAGSTGGTSTFAGLSAVGGAAGNTYSASQAGSPSINVFTFVISSLSSVNKGTGGEGGGIYSGGSTGSPGVLYVLRF
jgi:hypothetical protein